MRKIKIKRPKWRKPPTHTPVRAATTMIEGGGYYGCRAGDRLTMTTHNGERVVEVVEVHDGRVRVREVLTSAEALILNPMAGLSVPAPGHPDYVDEVLP